MNKEWLSKTTTGVSDESDVCVVFLLAAALVALVVLLVGCSPASSAPASPTAVRAPQLRDVRSISTGTTRTYLGAVSGTRALLGIVLDGAQVRAYVCDGTPSRVDG